MNLEEAKEKIQSFVKDNYLPLLIGTSGLIFIVYGLFGSKPQSNQDIQSSLGPKNVLGASQSPRSTADIMVDVEGAVVSPGVYKLGWDGRMKDALIAAGGLSSSADRNWTSHNINLAAKLVDGAKVYINSVNESIEGSSKSIGSIESSASGLININSATQAQMNGLPGVGDVTAGKIISGRPYSAVEDLLTRKIVSKKVFDSISDKVSVY